MSKYILLPVIITLLLVTGCSKDVHFITDSHLRKQLAADYIAKKEAMPYGNYFDIFDTDLPQIEREALAFLYTYMPIGDITDYTADFYLQNIRSSFKAQAEMPWGNEVPEELFRHFVLPVRINNENMDHSRMIFYEELKERVQGMSMYEAVLEVNHWCHEKVTYTPTDSRTSSPLATVKTAYGRCGEESVFTAAALRSIGIPARQVYTPRWAHTDNNHAWVEAWVNGKWYFLGACEPEPVLNMAWFNEPASRGMLMHTRAFGKYHGMEEIMEETDCFTEINVTDNYAPVSMVQINITDEKGIPVPDALVEFKLYNYAEFHTVARKITDKKGKATLSAGKGDMLVWVSKNGLFGFSKVTFGQDNVVDLILNKKPGDEIIINPDIIPPPSNPISTHATEEQKNKNNSRLAEEDEIRNSYIAGFCTEAQAKAFAGELGINEEKTVNYLINCRGNRKEIENFLRNVPQGYMDKAMSLLGVISAKDLRELSSNILISHLIESPDVHSEIDIRYLLNPRVSNELITSYRAELTRGFDVTEIESFRRDPTKLIQWIKNTIRVMDHLNPQKIPVLPTGVMKSKTADSHSRDIFFVSLARSLHIPSRIESITGKVQYYLHNVWHDVDFDALSPVKKEIGELWLTYEPKQTSKQPQYYNHFTIAQILPNGQLHTLNFRTTSVDMGTGSIWGDSSHRMLQLDKGNYLLITGTRMAKGNVMAHIQSFTIEPDKAVTQHIILRENTDDVEVIGNIDAEKKFNLTDNGNETSILNITGRGYNIIGILGPQQEPTNHALRDIAAVSQEFERWDRSMILLFQNENAWRKYKANEFGKLPDTITYGIDTDLKISEMIVKEMQLSDKNALPIFIIADSFGRVVFLSQGYTIGLGEQMMEVIDKISS